MSGVVDIYNEKKVDVEAREAHNLAPEGIAEEVRVFFLPTEVYL